MSVETFIPDLNLEARRLEVVEQTLGEQGLIDRHLRWVEHGKSPSADLTDIQYGHRPQSFSKDSAGMRPGREPIDFQLLATETLGLPYDTDYETLVRRINIVDTGWFGYLVKSELLTEDQANVMQEAAYHAYRFDTLTEDNLPTYVSTILGGFKERAHKYGPKIPATEEWAHIWSAEENGHMLSMNEYGKITSINTTREQYAGRNSQQRAGMDVELKHTIQLYAYVAWQELSTNLAHGRNGDMFGPVGSVLLGNVAADEARHHYLYYSVLKELYKEFPDDTVRTLHTELMTPFMPGSKGIPDFLRQSVRIHSSGVFGTEQAYEAARKVLQKLELLDEAKDVSGLSDEGKAALAELREQYRDPLAPTRKRRAKFVLDHTISIPDLRQARKNYASSIGLPEPTKTPTR